MDREWLINYPLQVVVTMATFSSTDRVGTDNARVATRGNPRASQLRVHILGRTQR